MTRGSAANLPTAMKGTACGSEPVAQPPGRMLTDTWGLLLNSETRQVTARSSEYT